MRILLDENLPSELVVELGALGHDVEDVHSAGLSGRPDDDVWRSAQSAARLLITQDIRFGDARMFTQGEHAGFVLVRLKRSGPASAHRQTEGRVRQPGGRVVGRMFRRPELVNGVFPPVKGEMNLKNGFLKNQ